MTHLKILTIAEDGNCSDRISAVQKVKSPLYVWEDEFYINIDTQKKLILSFGATRIQIPNIDINGMIEYLKEVKTFLNEQETMNRLMGIQ